MSRSWNGDEGYSAEVEIYLVVGDRRLPVSHLNKDSLILRTDESMPKGPATIVIRIDGRQTEYEVIVYECESANAVDSELAYAFPNLELSSTES